MNPTMSRIDDRDRAVLERLEIGQTVTPEVIKKLYRRHTDVRRSRTLRRRVEDLLHQPEFEDAGFKRWTFQGVE